MANQDGVDAGDIEEQSSSDNVAAASSTNSEHLNTASPIQQNPSNSKAFLAKPISSLRTLFTNIIPRFLRGIVRVLFWPLVSILSLSMAFFYILIKGDTTHLHFDGLSSNNSEEDVINEKGRSIKMKKAAIKTKIHQLTIVTAVRMGCLVLLWTVINLNVANLRRVTLLGSLLWKWSLLATLILLAYPILIYLLCNIFSRITHVLLMRNPRGNVGYYMEEIAGSMLLALYFTSLLLTWLLCVDTTNTQLHRYGTLTLVSLLVGGVLSLLKNSVLLWWRVTLIYNKYKEKILSAGCHLYFNLLFMDHDVPCSLMLLSWFFWGSYTPQEFVPVEPKSQEVGDHKVMPNRRKILPIEEYMSKRAASMTNVHEVATYLTNNFELSLTEDDYIPDIVPYLRSSFQTGHRPGYSLTEMRSSARSDEKLLLELLQVETSKENPPYEDFEKWMVDGLKYSYAVGNRIDGAFQVMRILNRVMTTFIVVVVILVWLIITGLATTKVVVGLASIFLGLTFVFGDTCKTFFQGAVFSFVTHPFDVADRCIIDDKELKVKKINILTTTFFGSQSKEIVLYPNSDLATKRITLLHGERESELKPERKAEVEASPDLTDFVEFNLPPQTTALQIESLQGTIERHLESGLEPGVCKNSYCVSVMEFGDSIKMRVNYEHVLSDGDNSKHLKSIPLEKQKQRSRLIIQLKKFVEDLGR